MTLIDPNAEAYYIGLMNAAGYRDKDLKKAHHRHHTITQH